MGSDNRMAPVRMTIKKLKAMTKLGRNLNI